MAKQRSRRRSTKLGRPRGGCTSFKRVRTSSGKMVRRCAKFSGASKSRSKAGTKRSARRKGLGRVGQPTGQRCTSFKRVRTKNGNMVRRCAKFSGSKTRKRRRSRRRAS